MKQYNSVLLIYNPNAMRGKIDEYVPHIKQRLLLRFPVVEVMSSPEVYGAEAIALKHAPRFDIVLACGGDGTLNQIINGVKKSNSNAIVGILPFGTCNDVARTLEIEHDLDKSIDSVLRLNTTQYDLMFDGTDYISYSMATGYLVKSVYNTTNSTKKKFGRFAYFIYALKRVFKFRSLPLTITYDGERVHGMFNYFMLLNGDYAGGFRIHKNNDISNGKATMVLIKKSKGIVSFFTFLKLFFFGVKSIRKSKHAIIREVSNVEIENHSNYPFTIDGEKGKFLKKKISIKTDITMIRN